MDQRELESQVKQLTKCISANEAPENALRILEILKKDAAPTEEMLRVRSALILFAFGRYLRLSPPSLAIFADGNV